MRQLSPALQRSIARAAARVEERTRRWPALLGDPNGIVSVPGRRNYVYVLMPDGTVAQAYDVTSDRAPGRPVIVGYRPWNPALLVVLDASAAYSELPAPSGGGPASSGLGPHHQSHEHLAAGGGTDVVYSQARQLLPLRVEASGLTVTVYNSPLLTGAGWVDQADTLDLSGDLPTTGARWALIYLDADGALARRLSTPVALLLLTTRKIPLPGAGEYALAAARLYEGQTEIVETQYQQDLVDLRFSGQGRSFFTPGQYRQFTYIVSGGDFSFIIDSDGNPVMALQNLE